MDVCGDGVEIAWKYVNVCADGVKIAWKFCGSVSRLSGDCVEVRESVWRLLSDYEEVFGDRVEIVFKSVEVY